MKTLKELFTSLGIITPAVPAYTQAQFNQDITKAARLYVMSAEKRDLTQLESDFFASGAHGHWVTGGASAEVVGMMIMQRILRKQSVAFSHYYFWTISVAAGRTPEVQVRFAA